MGSAIASRSTPPPKIWKRAPTCCCARRCAWLVSRASAPVTSEGHNMATVTRLTCDDLKSIPEERPGDRHEIIDGELVVTPSPAPMHQIVSRDLFRLLDQHVRTSDLGEVLYAPVDIRLTPDNVLIPDITYIARPAAHHRPEDN